jgi:uncharacterized protein YjbI with pentapeptide repeats
MSEDRQRPKSWTTTKARVAKWKLPFVWSEWVCEWIAYGCSNWAFIEVLEYGGKLAVVATAILYFWSADERQQAVQDARKAKHYVAWQTLNSAIGKPGNAGRKDALEDLNRDGASLDAVDISGGAVLIGPLSLTNARLDKALLSNASMTNVDFSGAYLHNAQLTNVTIHYGSFCGSEMFGTVLTDSRIWNSDFYDANLVAADLRFSSFYRVNFAKASMASSQFESRPIDGKRMPNTVFDGCNFAEANLSDIDGDEGINMYHCNIYGLFTLSNVVDRARRSGRNVEVNITNHTEWLKFLKTNKVWGIKK